MGLLNVNKMLSVGRNRVAIHGSFRPNGVTGIVSGSVKGLGYTVARASAGLYTITFSDFGVALDSFIVGNRQLAGAWPVNVEGGVVSASGKTAQIRATKIGAGYIPLPLGIAREQGAGPAPINIAGFGGILASDTHPALVALTGNKEQGLTWPAGNADIVGWIGLPTPPDFNENVDATFKARAQVTKAGGAIVDHVGLVVQVQMGTNKTNCGGTSTHITTGTLMTVTRALAKLAAGDNMQPYPNTISVFLSPEAHATDSIEVASAWIEYCQLADLAADVDDEIDFVAVFRNSGANS